MQLADVPADLGQRWRSSGSVRGRAPAGQLGRLRATMRKSFRSANQSQAEVEPQRTLMEQMGVGAARLLRNVYTTKRAAELADLGAGQRVHDNGSFRVLEASRAAPKKSQQELLIEQRLRRSRRRVLPSARYQAPESERACDGLNLDQLEEIKRDNLRLTLRQGSVGGKQEPGAECSCSPFKLTTDNSQLADCSCSPLDSSAVVDAQEHLQAREIHSTEPRLTASQRDQIEDRLRILFEPNGGKNNLIPVERGLSPEPLAEERDRPAERPLVCQKLERSAQSHSADQRKLASGSPADQQQVAADKTSDCSLDNNQIHIGTESKPDQIFQSSADLELDEKVAKKMADWDGQEHLYATICNHSQDPSSRVDDTMVPCRCTVERAHVHEGHLFGKQLELAEPREEPATKPVAASKRTFLSRLKEFVRPAKRNLPTNLQVDSKPARHRSYTLSSKSAQKLLMNERLHRVPSMLSVDHAGQESEYQMKSAQKSSIVGGFFTLGRLHGARSMSCLKQVDQVPISELFHQESKRQELARLRAAARFSGSADSLPSADSGLSCSNLQNSSSCDENYQPQIVAAKSVGNLYSNGPCVSDAKALLVNRDVVGRARAKVDCNPCAYDREALVFRRGDIIDILERNQSGTWIGHCNGQVGHFKFISVEEIVQQQEESKQQARPFITKLEIRSSKREAYKQQKDQSRSLSLESIEFSNDKITEQRLDTSKETIMSSLEQLLFAIGLAGQQVRSHTNAGQTLDEPYLDILNKGGINSLDSFSAIDNQHELEQIGILNDEHQRRLLMAAKIIRQASHAAKLDFVENCRTQARLDEELEFNRLESSSSPLGSATSRQLKRSMRGDEQAYCSQAEVGKLVPPPRATSSERAENDLETNTNEPIYINLLRDGSTLRAQNNARELNQLIASTTDLTVTSREPAKPRARAHDPPAAASSDQYSTFAALRSSRPVNRGCRSNSPSPQEQQIVSQSDNRLPARRTRLPAAATSIKTKPETHDRKGAVWLNSHASRTASLHNSGSNQINQQDKGNADYYHLRRLKVTENKTIPRPSSSTYVHSDVITSTASSDEEDGYLALNKQATSPPADRYEGDATVASTASLSSYSRLNRGYSVRVAAANRRCASRNQVQYQSTEYCGNQSNPRSESNYGRSNSACHANHMPIATDPKSSVRKRTKQLEQPRQLIDGQQRRPSRFNIAASSSSKVTDGQVLLERAKLRDDNHQQSIYNHASYYHIRENFADMHAHHYHLQPPSPAHHKALMHHQDHRQHHYDHERREAQVVNCIQQPTIVVPQLRSQINSSKSAYDLRLDLSHFFS